MPNKLSNTIELAKDLVAFSTDSADIKNAVDVFEDAGEFIVVSDRSQASNLAEARLLPVLRHIKTGELSVQTGRMTVRWGAKADKKEIVRKLKQIGFSLERDYGSGGVIGPTSIDPATAVLSKLKVEDIPELLSVELQTLRHAHRK